MGRQNVVYALDCCTCRIERSFKKNFEKMFLDCGSLLRVIGLRLDDYTTSPFSKSHVSTFYRQSFFRNDLKSLYRYDMYYQKILKIVKSLQFSHRIFSLVMPLKISLNQLKPQIKLMLLFSKARITNYWFKIKPMLSSFVFSILLLRNFYNSKT